MTTNYSRLDSFLTQQENRLNEIRTFVADKKQTIESQRSNIDNFLKEVGGTDFEIGNMYSTHHNEEQYTKQASLIAHCTFNTKKEFKNKELLIKKLQQAWNVLVADCIHAKFNFWQIKGNVVKFQVWVKDMVMPEVETPEHAHLVATNFH